MSTLTVRDPGTARHLHYPGGVGSVVQRTVGVVSSPREGAPTDEGSRKA